MHAREACDQKIAERLVVEIICAFGAEDGVDALRSRHLRRQSPTPPESLRAAKVCTTDDVYNLAMKTAALCSDM